MNWAQTVNTLIFVFGTFASVLEAIHLSKYLTQRLPEHTTVKLEQFARLAVLAVEQTNPALSGPAKKELATATVILLFQSFKLPMPKPKAVDIAIEASVQLLPEGKEANG